MTQTAGLKPTVKLDFARSLGFGPGFSCVRSTTAVGGDKFGWLKTEQPNTPRLHFEGATGACLGARFEPSRINLLIRSALDHADWTKTRSIAFGAPNFSAFRPAEAIPIQQLSADASNNTHLLLRDTAVTANTVNTFSMFARAADLRYLTLQFGNADGTPLTDSITIKVDTLLGLVLTTTITGAAILKAPIKVVPVRQYNLFRFEICALINATSTSLRSQINILDNNQNASFLGDIAKFIYAQAPQVEAGYGASSPILTAGATVTRNADKCSVLDSGSTALWRGFEVDPNNILTFMGTWVVRGRVGNALDATVHQTFFSDNDGTTSNGIKFRLNGTNSTLNFLQVAAGVNVFSLLDTVPITLDDTDVIACMRLRKGDAALITNIGKTLVTSTAPVSGFTVTNLNIGSDVAVSQLNGTVAGLEYYPFVFSDYQMQKMVGAL